MGIRMKLLQEEKQLLNLIIIFNQESHVKDKLLLN